MRSKPPLLFLAHRIPYPPNKGDKIRSWHLLKHLAEHFSIYLGTFVDDPEDWQYADTLREHCGGVCFITRHPRLHKLWSARGLLYDEALSVTYYRSRALQRWVDNVVAQVPIERALVFCSPMAQFVAPTTAAGQSLTSTVIDLVDVDSEKWHQYAEEGRGLLSRLYAREGRRLLEWERKAAERASATFLVSRSEARLFSERAGLGVPEVSFFSNGVDTDYFAPQPDLPNPYPDGVRPIVFTGAMDYPPNEEAVCWFAAQVLDRLADIDGLQFWIVGGKPTERVRQLATSSSVVVTGRVPDVRPYLQHAAVAVAPMRIARGIQNKVLEAMAMGKPVIASDCALEGVETVADQLIAGSDDPDTFANAVRQALHENVEPEKIRAALCEHFSWERNLGPVINALR